MSIYSFHLVNDYNAFHQAVRPRRQPQARYALFDISSRSLEVHAIDYDWDAARAAIIAAGLPKMLGDRLLQGR